MTNIWPFLVVLAPALLSAMLGIFATVTPWVKTTLRPWFKNVLKSEERVEHLREQMVNISFIGPATGIYLGFAENSLGASLVGLILFVLFQGIAWMMVGMLERIRTESAGLVSSQQIEAIVQRLQEQDAQRRAANQENWRD